MSGKGSTRRHEDTAKVEANWPTNWDARNTATVDNTAVIEGCTCDKHGDCFVCDEAN